MPGTIISLGFGRSVLLFWALRSGYLFLGRTISGLAFAGLGFRPLLCSSILLLWLSASVHALKIVL